MASNFLRLASLNFSSRFEIPVLQSPRTPSSASIHENLSLDPLLADLSPSSVLEAFRDADNLPQSPGSPAKSLADSIAEASAHERALGIRAALAGKRVRDWVIELQEWNWPREAFQTPADKEQDAYWGSLYSQVVLEREERLERIREGLSLLETEDLKNHVRNIHLRRKSRTTPESSDSPGSPISVSYDHLADFDVIVTAIITQTLPELVVLTRLIGDWSARISVLRRLSGFGQQLGDAKMALESAWTTIEQATNSGNGLILTRDTYEQIKHILGNRVNIVAQTIDTILDTLEGHKDRIPDQWIDDVEEVEADYKNWVVEAERLVRLYEWQTSEVHLEAAIIAALSEENGESNIVNESGIELLSTPEANDPATPMKDTPIMTYQSNKDEEPNIVSDTILKVYPTNGHGNTIDSSITPSKDGARELSPISELLPPIYLEPKREVRIGKHTNNSDTLLLSQPSTKSASSKAEQFLVTPQGIGKAHRRADSSPLDTGYGLFQEFNNTLENLTLENPGRKTTPLILRNRATSDGASYQHYVNSSNTSTPNHTLGLLPETTNGLGNDLNTVDQESNSEFSSQLQIEKTQQELNDDTENLAIGNASPSLMIRKVRLQNNSGHSTQLTDDKMTAKISRLLKKIPAPIQLTDHSSQTLTGAGSEGKSGVRAQQQTSSPSGLTLSPVAAKARNTQLNDLGVRVYHLHQAGREVPIKLFIRLVGNDERVMVRVGGGWADLAEYLKEYAIHHGRRSVSNNNFELAGSSPAKAAANSIFNAARSPTSSSATTPVHRPVTPSHNSTKESSISESTGPTVSPDLNQLYRSRARSTSPLQEDEISALGLGGPKSKNIELSPQKRAWVDGMLGQARQLSSEHRKIDEIGDLGKVGNTKRVFLRAAGDNSTSK